MYLKVFGLPGEYQIEIDKEAIPRQNYITTDLKVKLDILTKNDVIAKVDYSTLWISNMVSVRKPNGTLRVCIDPSILNKMDLEDETESSIKEESDIDNTHVDSVPDGSFPRVERNEDSPSSVFDQCDDNPTDIEHEELDEDCNQENCENIVEFTISTKINKIICDVDVSHYETNQTLEMNNIKPLEEKVYECNVCQKSFERIGSLTKHMQIHINAKPFECDICHKCFTQSSNLKVHMYQHTNSKPFECDVCHKCFSQQGNLKRHVRLHTNEKPFKCDFCHKCFNVKSRLNEHTRVHTNEKPFECDVCQKCFSRNDILKDHKYTHTNEKPFKCDVCNKGFAQRRYMRKHMRVHTNIVRKK